MLTRVDQLVYVALNVTKRRIEVSKSLSHLTQTATNLRPGEIRERRAGEVHLDVRVIEAVQGRRVPARFSLERLAHNLHVLQ